MVDKFRVRLIVLVIRALALRHWSVRKVGLPQPLPGRVSPNCTVFS